MRQLKYCLDQPGKPHELMMLKPFLSLLFISSVSLSTSQTPFEEEINDAFVFIAEHQDLICNVSSKFNTSPSKAVSLGFPELIRYSLVKDLFETSALELLYEDLGSREVDFSIGPFQMKPSFVERLEKVILQHSLTFENLQFITTYKKKDVKSIRAERLERLKSVEWQLNYLFAFYEVLELVFQDEAFCSEEEKIAFFASAYNTGFDVDRNFIRKWQTEKAFPYGRKYKGPQVAYSEIALRFFEEKNPQKPQNLFCVNH
ncbi:MAG: hypothetical protein R2879_08180 [Saprospiraceae bacterium]